MVSGVRAAYPSGTVAEGIYNSFGKRDEERNMQNAPWAIQQ
jgi:hypothetical protein